MTAGSGTAADQRQGLLDEYHKAIAPSGRKAPAWLAGLREAAIARFADVGFPSTRQEDWRFTSVAPLANLRFSRMHWHPRPQIGREHLGLMLPPGPGAAHAVFVNGRFAPNLSSVGGLPAGVRLGSLADTIQRNGAAGAAIERHLGRHALVDRNPFTALATAFVEDGAFLYVPAGVEVEAPVQLLFLAAPGDGPSASYPRVLIVAERGARVSVVETYAGVEDRAYLTSAVTELVAQDGAQIASCRIQRESELAYHMATSQVYQGPDSSVQTCTVAVGSALSRHDVGAVLGGAGGYLILNGLSVLHGRQHVDHHTTIDHAAPHCESHELFNGILDDHARGVFTGRIIVRPGAQRTDSKQTNNNLLLSEEARADSQPQLEIHADDVKCTHGATLGPLDPAALFYLQTRGIAPHDARDLMTYGFSAQIIGTVPVPELRRQLDRLVRATLDRGARRPRAVP
ncbi:MAG: Fe-S cluster assembly protein SufD [Gemmatimonadetes bacterium]|nr:Fe-S cluster assembly protein SufD [Gemmatimonadota bacterium]